MSGTYDLTLGNRRRGSRFARRIAFTLVELLVVIAIIGILVALLLPAIQAAREAARRAQCQSNLKNVALAVLNYESSKKKLPLGSTFPSDGDGNVPGLPSNMQFRESWLVEVLPFLEYQPLFDSFVFKTSAGAPVPMTDDINHDERGTLIPVLLCPSDRMNNVKYEGHGGNWARGNYAANSGAGAWHPKPTPPGVSTMGPNSSGWKGYAGRGVMGPNATVEIQQITDGTSKTMMLGEIRAGLSERDMRGTWAFGHAGGNILAWHGWGGDDNGPNFCGPDADDIAAGAELSGDQALALECMTVSPYNGNNQATSRSTHTGGVFIAMCDGSVQFINDDIETSGIWGTCCKPWDHLILSIDGGWTGNTTRPPRGD